MPPDVQYGLIAVVALCFLGFLIAVACMEGRMRRVWERSRYKEEE